METMAVPMVPLRVDETDLVVFMPRYQWELKGRPAKLSCTLSKVLDKGGMLPDSKDSITITAAARMMAAKSGDRKTVQACRSQINRAVSAGGIPDNGERGPARKIDRLRFVDWMARTLEAEDGETDDDDDAAQPGRPSLAEQRRRLGIR